MPFQNRQQAADLLAARLSKYQGQNPLIMGIPRGAVPMAARLAEVLDGDLDVVLVHKLRAPRQPELAIGSVDESGDTYLSPLVETLKVSPQFLRQEKEAQLRILHQRREMYTPLHPPVSPSGRIVIVVDDGIATGATMISALRSIRRKNSKKLVLAVAVAHAETLQRIASEADEVICLETPAVFYAVGEFFADFGQVSDEEVARILQQSRCKPPDRMEP